MGTINRIEDELNAVRVKLYEQIKDMTPDEEVAYLKQLSTPVRKEFGIHTVSERREKAPRQVSQG